jgi:uncharacterized FAD-dependent dehydrogenase
LIIKIVKEEKFKGENKKYFISESMTKYDVIIVGAGPAGLATAYRIVKMRPETSVLILEKGPPLEKRVCDVKKGLLCKKHVPCRVVSGPGGAGAFSDGKVYFFRIGGYLEHEGDPLLTSYLIEAVRYYFESLFPEGLPGKELKPHLSDKLKTEIEKAGLTYKLTSPHHIGTENCEEFVRRIISDLEKHNVKISYDTEATNINHNNDIIMVECERHGEKIVYQSSILVLAVGKGGSEWLSNQMSRLGIQPQVLPSPDIGVRIETSSAVLERLKELGGDPKLYWYRGGGTQDRVKTHCFADNGYTILIPYENEITLVDGYSYISPEKSSGRSSVNVLARTSEKISHEVWFHFLKGYKLYSRKGLPLLQRYGDFLDMIPTSEEKIKANSIKPTLTSYELEDINQILPRRILELIIEFIERLAKIAPGINNSDTLVYAPAAEWYIPRYIPYNPITKEGALTHRMRPTNFKNIFIVGDGAGLSQGIVMAATTGFIAGDTIATELL